MDKRHSTRARRAVRSTHHKPAKASARSRGTLSSVKGLPNLDHILAAAHEAEALIACAYTTVLHSKTAGPEGAALRIGLEKLRAVSNLIDDAANQLHHFAKARRVRR